MMVDRQLSDLVRMDAPEAVLTEVQIILKMIAPDFNTAAVNTAFTLAVSLYEGNFAGYRPCNTEYHNLRHTTDTFLAMTRQLHGAVLDGETFTDRQIILGLICILFHDAGYIQEEQDREGTGAKHTTSHVRRSMDFLKRHGSQLGLSAREVTAGRAIICCTDLAVDIAGIRFPSPKIELLGKIVGTADLLAQMADRAYLEKLLFLYKEFREARVNDYQSEVDLLRKTIGFYDFIAQRLKKPLDGTHRFLQPHFLSRWGINKDLYHEAIEKQKNYLRRILKIPDTNPLTHLRRDGIVKKIKPKVR